MLPPVVYSPIKPKSTMSAELPFPEKISGSVTERFDVSTVVPSPPKTIVPSILTSPLIFKSP